MNQENENTANVLECEHAEKMSADAPVRTMVEVERALMMSSTPIKVVMKEDEIMIVEYDGIPVSLFITGGEVPRLRMSVDVARLDSLNEEKMEEVLFELLDLNTEIDPIATAIDTSDEENVLIVARTTLEVGYLQAKEVLSAFETLIFRLPEVRDIVAV